MTARPHGDASAAPLVSAFTPSGPERARWGASARLGSVALLMGCLGFGVGVGASLHATAGLMSNDLASPHAGACVALELAMAHGYLDETKKRIVMRTLVDPRNPYADRFGTSHVALARTCAKVYERRWAP